jgi:hypothetical protein
MWEFFIGLFLGATFGFFVYALINSEELDRLDRPSDTRKK